ncbi:MAG: hypothetical protein QY306_12795 [Anaerolineales bacterium]|nr:MAG: hypothetical protein QY306_12795 [Anaerolineales bacterium]
MKHDDVLYARKLDSTTPRRLQFPLTLQAQGGLIQTLKRDRRLNPAWEG